MGTWGPGNYENDAALDFINEEADRYISVIEAIFGDEQRFLLDEDAEGMLMPSVEILSLLCARCHGVLPKDLDVAAWKSRYLEMYDHQIDGLEPDAEYKQQRRAVIEATFEKLLQRHQEQWRRDEQ
jgi:hypothetical protein